ncbi:cell division protein FtsQ/DivIB [Magnetospirillum molischianum]|uniref:Cell division protein FtsQ n=1 Tax=Magnetospirillum molischianum DSM 120 TaxID=1150626 RepID=H8FMQ1_MAGML|nr:cell division protein FtsQ/DivIB [Magnetospirillum molischianum]CCG39639.1 Cell division septal protein [Magnetospirillum molischianum DSM 120]
MRRISAADIVITPDDRPGNRSSEPPRPQKQPRQPQTAARGRRRAQRFRFDLTPVQKFASIGVALTALFVGGAMVWQSGFLQKVWRDTGDSVLHLTAMAGFRTTEITVAGRRRIPTDQIVAALGARHGDPILGLDIVAARDRLEALPGIRAAVIERRLPGSLHLVIVEREPVALWQYEGVYTLVDRDGKVIPGSIEGFEDLPLVVGEGAGARADELLTMLSSAPDLAMRVKAATRVGNRRWNLTLDDIRTGLEVRLPEVEPEVAWNRLADLERSKGLASRPLAMIDMRVPDRLVLRPGRDLPQSAERPPQAPAAQPSALGLGKED